MKKQSRRLVSFEVKKMTSSGRPVIAFIYRLSGDLDLYYWSFGVNDEILRDFEYLVTLTKLEFMNFKTSLNIKHS